MAKNGKKSRANPTLNPLSPKARTRLSRVLNARLADTLDLHSQTKQAHWNLTGPQFIALHELFDATATLLAGQADQIAERAVILGGAAEGTLRLGAKASTLPEMPAGRRDGLDFTSDLAERLALHATQLRVSIDEADDCNDPITSDLLTQITADVEKQLWFLESHLES